MNLAAIQGIVGGEAILVANVAEDHHLVFLFAGGHLWQRS